MLQALTAHGVEFRLVGGQAAVSYGARRLTHDLDVCIRWDDENRDRMGRVLDELDAGLRVEGMAEPFRVPHRDGAFIEGLEISTWRSDAGDVDVLRGLPAPGREVRFDELRERASVVTMDGIEVAVASLDDIIVSKQTLDRPSDREALPELVAIALRARSGPDRSRPR